MALMHIFVALLLATAASAQSTTSTTLTHNEEVLATPPEDFIYSPSEYHSATPVSTVGGTSTPRMLEQWPTLAGYGIAMTVFEIDGCALRPPHVHQRASGMLTVITGSNLTVGFVSESGIPIVNTVSAGESALFPQGLIHYQLNNECTPAQYVIAYGNEDPGTQVVAPSLLALPADAVYPALGLSASSYSNVVTDLPTTAFTPNANPECVARCSMAAVTPATSVGGR